MINRLTPQMIFGSTRMASDLAHRSIRGGMNALTSQGIQMLLRIIEAAVLGRLLAPNDYGLVAMVAVFINFVKMFSDLGLSTVTVQRDHISREQISTLFWLNVSTNGVLGLCILAASPLVSLFYGRPELTGITAMMSGCVMVGGLTVQHQALLRRHLRFGLLACIQIGSLTVSLTVTIVLALFGLGIRALVAGAVADVLAGVILTFCLCPWMPGRLHRWTGIRESLRFGSHLTGFGLANFLFSKNTSSLLIGRFIGPDALGLYARACQMLFPINQIRSPLGQVALPVLSSLRSAPERYVRYYQRYLDATASLGLPLAVYFGFEADFLVRLLLGPAWLGAIPLFRMLAIVVVLQSLVATTGTVQLSFGFSRRYLNWGVVGAGVSVLAIMAGISSGIDGVAVAIAIANLALFLPTLFYCLHGSPISIALVLKTLTPPTLVSVAALGGAILADYVVKGDTLSRHIAIGVVFLAVVGGGYSLRKSVRDTLRMALQSKSIRFREEGTPYGAEESMSSYA